MVEQGYEVVIEQGGERWRWSLRADGVVAASGPAETEQTAERSGAFAAADAGQGRQRRRDLAGCQAAAR